MSTALRGHEITPGGFPVASDAHAVKPAQKQEGVSAKTNTGGAQEEARKIP